MAIGGNTRNVAALRSCRLAAMNLRCQTEMIPVSEAYPYTLEVTSRGPGSGRSRAILKLAYAGFARRATALCACA